LRGAKRNAASQGVQSYGVAAECRGSGRHGIVRGFAGRRLGPPKPPSAKSGDKITLTQPQLKQIGITTVENCTFRTLKPGIGQIAFNEDASTVVLTPFSGRVTKLHAKIGDSVKTGAPLFELESPEVVQAQTDLLSALQAVGKAKAQQNTTQRALDRQSSLNKVKATSQREVDQASSDYAAADADFKSAENALTAARKRLRVLIGRSDEEIVRLERERVINPSITVNAPIDGTIVGRKIGPGQYVRSDVSEPLFSIADLATMWLKAAVPENDIPLIRVGQEIEVKVAAMPDKTFKARIAAIGCSHSPRHRAGGAAKCRWHP
jgi:membrane fusion protein, heavy metal efflux system